MGTNNIPHFQPFPDPRHFLHWLRVMGGADAAVCLAEVAPGLWM